MSKDKIWIPLFIITIAMLLISAYAIYAAWPQKMISLMGITCFLLTGATILTKNLRW